MKAKILGVVVIILALAGLGAAYQFRLFNRAPKADFEIKPKYINPTDETLTKFVNRSEDPDGDRLTFSWYVDGRLVNSSRDHTARLTAGNHTVRLEVGDGKAQGSFERKITVDRASIYPVKKLSIPIKGINYWSGNLRSSTFPSRISAEVEEDLLTVKQELGCNGIQFRGSDEDNILACAEIAIRLGFEVVILNSFEIDQHVVDLPVKIRRFAEKAQGLFERSKSIVLSIGDEMSLSCRGILSSATYEGRIAEIRNISARDRARFWPVLDSHLRFILGNVSQVFKGRVTYGAGTWEEVDWKGLAFDVIGINYFFRKQDEVNYLRRAQQLKQMAKPFWVTATGCATFEDAYDYAGAGWQVASDKTYSQEAQGAAIGSIVRILDQAEVGACFLANFKESKSDDRTSFGILRYNGREVPFSRKLGFYAYKSYVMANRSSTVKSEFGTNLTIPSLPLTSNWMTATMMFSIPIQTASRASRVKAGVR